LLVAALQSGMVEAQDPPPTAKKQEGRRLIDVAGPPAGGPRPAPRRDPNLPKPDLDAAPASVPVPISGVIRDLNDRPIAGATVYALGTQTLDEPKLTVTTTVVGKTTSARDGSYSFPDLKIPTSRKRHPYQAATPYVTYQVEARAPGYGLGWHLPESMYAINPPDPADIQGHATLGSPVVMNVYLRPEADLKGRVIDENDKPVAGVKINLMDVNLMDERGMETPFGVGVRASDWPDGFGLTVTDADGRFKLSGLPSESCCWLFLERADSKGNAKRAVYASTLAENQTQHDRQQRNPQVQAVLRGSHEVFPRDMTVSMPSLRTIEVHVVADDDGKPVPNVRVISVKDALATGFSSYGYSNAEGVVELSLPVDRYKGLSGDPDSTDSRFIRSTGNAFEVKDEPNAQRLELRMQPGFELLLEAVDSATGKGVPGIYFEIKQAAEGPWLSLRPSTFYAFGETTTNAEGKLRAVLAPAPGRSYQVRVLGAERGDPRRPPRAPLPPTGLPYDVTPTVSEAFEPASGNVATYRFLLKKRDR
jgi:protocatechuate 3,4-dioxygenase beta subunit